MIFSESAEFDRFSFTIRIDSNIISSVFNQNGLENGQEWMARDMRTAYISEFHTLSREIKEHHRNQANSQSGPILSRFCPYLP